MIGKELFDEELKASNGKYLKNVIPTFAPSLLYYSMKLKILLKLEKNGQDENHWKGELKGAIRPFIKDFDGIRNKEELFNKLCEQISNAFIYVNNRFKREYPKWFEQLKGITIKQINNIASELFPKLTDFIYNTYYEIRKIDDKEKDKEISNRIGEFIDENF